MSYPGIPLFDRLNQTRTRNATAIAGSLSLLVAIGSYSSIPVASKATRPILYALTALSSLVSLSSFTTRDQQVFALADHEKLADQARQNATSELFSQESKANTNYYATANVPVNQYPLVDLPNQFNSPVPIPSYDYFNWDDLADEVEYPHIAILNKTGGGKSTLAQWLAKQLGGKVYAVDPHWEPGSYDKADLIIGKGRNTGESAESWQSITNKKGEVVGEKGEPEIEYPNEHCTVTQFMNWLHREMVARYEMRMQGNTNFEPINVIFDEFSSYARKEGFSTRFKELIREARKVKIRMFVLIQGSQVGDLGLEGSSDLRSNLTFIRIGKFAKDYAALRLRNAKPKTVEYEIAEEIVRAIANAKRPALIEDHTVGDIPDLS
jgi:hypothetical protein